VAGDGDGDGELVDPWGPETDEEGLAVADGLGRAGCGAWGARAAGGQIGGGEEEDTAGANVSRMDVLAMKLGGLRVEICDE
jgi:hypothetical protein